MRALVYQVTFLSDIVLQASSNTEGKIEVFDFIAGSNFLGMVARNYDKFEDSFDMFHSGKVRFGDATLLKEGKQTYKMPLCYFHEKLNDKKMFNHHFIEDFTIFNQLKQKRNGYITRDKELLEIEYNYAQKSAYDKVNRKSLESSMFGYTAIRSGTQWQFSVEVDENISKNDFNLLKESLVGKKRLGKSKSAQYGLVEIREQGNNESIKKISQNRDEIVLYANSRLALVDECGNPTYDLNYLFDGVEIVYDKCQIRTSSFTPYNGAMQTKTYERVCINKGSVIVIKAMNKEDIPSLVGAYWSEGFGEILINPEFLSDKESFTLISDCKDETLISRLITEDIVKFLMKRVTDKKSKLDIAEKVSEFIDSNKNIYDKKMNAQWGTIRSLCANSSDENIKVSVQAYITEGIAKTKWEGKKTTQLLEAIEMSEHPLQFVKLLSIQMPKVKNIQEQNND